MQTALSRANEVSQIPYTAHRSLTDSILWEHICFSMYVPNYNAEALVGLVLNGLQPYTILKRNTTEADAKMELKRG